MDNEKKLTLNYLRDMFNGTFDEDVIESVLEQRNWDTDRALDDLMNLAQGCTFDIPIEDFSDTTPSSQQVNSTSSNLVSDYIVQNGGGSVGDGKAESEDEIIVVDEEEFCLTGESESDDAKSTTLKPLVIEQPSSSVPSYANIARKNPPPVYQRMPQIQPPAILYQGYTSFERMKRTRDSLERVKLFVSERSKIMIILRGCSGSGKTSLAKQILKCCELDMKNPYWYIHSADNYFHLNNLGTYQYERGKRDNAHKWNQKNALCVVHEGLTPVIIDNTHSEIWEMEVYARMAVCAGYEIEVIEPDTPWAFQASQLTKRSCHAVDKEVIVNMLKRYEYNVSSSVLLKSFHMEYAADNFPPQTGTCELTNKPLVSLFEDLYNAIHVFPKQLKELRKQQRPSRKARRKQREMEEKQLDDIVKAIENCDSENDAENSIQDEIDLEDEIIRSFVKSNLNSATAETTSDSDKSWEDVSEDSCASLIEEEEEEEDDDDDDDEEESAENSGDESDDAENDTNDSDNDSNDSNSSVSSHESAEASKNKANEEAIPDDGNDENSEPQIKPSETKNEQFESITSDINCVNSIIDSFKNPAHLEENELSVDVNAANKNKFSNRLYDVLSKNGPRLSCFENFHDNDFIDEVDNERVADVSDPAIIQNVEKLIAEDANDSILLSPIVLESEASTSIVENILNNASDEVTSYLDISDILPASESELPKATTALANEVEDAIVLSNVVDSSRTSAESFHDAQESLNSSFVSPEVTVIYNEPDKLNDAKSNKSLKNVNAAVAGNVTSSSAEDDRNSLLNEVITLTCSVESDTSLSYRNNLIDSDYAFVEGFTNQIISSSKFKPISDEMSTSNVMIRNVIENDLWGDSFEYIVNATGTDRNRGTSENSDENSDYGSNSSSSDELRFTDIHNSSNRFVNNDIKGDVATGEKKKQNVNVLQKNKNAAVVAEEENDCGSAWNIDSTVELNTLKERILVSSLDKVLGLKLPAVTADDTSIEESDIRPVNVSRKSSCGATFQLIENNLGDKPDTNLERDQEDGAASATRENPQTEADSKFWSQWMKGDSWDPKETAEAKDSCGKNVEAKPPRANLSSADSPSKQKNTDIPNSIRLVNDIKNADKNKILGQKLKSVNFEPMMNDYFKHRSYPNSEEAMFGLPAAYDVKFKNILHDASKETAYYGINTMPKKINEENSDTDDRARPSCSRTLTDNSSDTDSRRSPSKRKVPSKNDPIEPEQSKLIHTRAVGKKPEEKTSPEFVDELVRRWKSIAMEETQPDYDKVLKWSPVTDVEDILDWNAEENKYSAKISNCAKPPRASSQSNVNYFMPEEIASSKRDTGTNTGTDDVSEGVRCLVARCREINVNRDVAEVSSIELKMKCDKSTMTEGSCYTVKVKPIREDLSNMFPKEMADSILDLYEKCNGNMDWIIEILMEDGYSPTDDQLEYLSSLQNVVSHDVTVESSARDKEKPTSEKKKSKQNGNGGKNNRRNNNQLEDRSPFESPKRIKKKKLDLREETKQSAIFDKEAYLVDEAPFNVETPDEDSNEGSVELFLDATMVQQLIGYFGNPTVYNMNDCQTVINVPISLARQIHASLLESVIDQAEKNEFLINQLAEDELITEDNQNIETITEVTQNDITEVENSLSDVINSHVAESSNNENSFASKLSLDLLLKSFPTLDPSYVTSTFKLNNYNYYDTKKVLNQMTPEVATNLTFNLKENKGNLVDRIRTNNDVPLFEPAAASLARNDILEQVNSYRDDAAFNYEQWQKFNEQLKTALQRKRFGVAPYYRELMSAFKQKYDEANANAAAVLITSCCKNSNVIDLHFFKVTEAMRALDIFLDHHITRLISTGRSKTTLYIITGRGAGNSGGVSLLQPPIKSRLKKRSIDFEVQPYNTGLVVATVRKNSPLTNDL